jgi:hypothetical protein
MEVLCCHTHNLDAFWLITINNDWRRSRYDGGISGPLSSNPTIMLDTRLYTDSRG